MAETMGALGLAFVRLTKFETEEAMYDSQRIRAADSRRVATAAVKASRACRDLNVQTVKYLVVYIIYISTAYEVIVFMDLIFSTFYFGRIRCMNI
jgi:hypothetical protein